MASSVLPVDTSTAIGTSSHVSQNKNLLQIVSEWYQSTKVDNVSLSHFETFIDCCKKSRTLFQEVLFANPGSASIGTPVLRDQLIQNCLVQIARNYVLIRSIRTLKNSKLLEDSADKIELINLKIGQLEKESKKVNSLIEECLSEINDEEPKEGTNWHYAEACQLERELKAMQLDRKSAEMRCTYSEVKHAINSIQINLNGEKVSFEQFKRDLLISSGIFAFSGFYQLIKLLLVSKQGTGIWGYLLMGLGFTCACLQAKAAYDLRCRIKEMKPLFKQLNQLDQQVEEDSRLLADWQKIVKKQN